MSIKLKAYQEKAVGELISSVGALLSKEGQGKVCVFRAPTGSGKTLMTAKFIEGIIGELSGLDLCFLWVSIGKGELHLQSKRSLEKVFSGAPKVSLVEEEFSGGREKIERNEVVVANWEKLRNKDQETGDWKSVLMKDGEKSSFRDVLSKTREERKIILIIDESHIGATAERTNELRDEISADVVLEMSATPKISPNAADLIRGTAGYVLVEPKDVIDEGMIKKELIINEGIGEIGKSEMDSQKVVLETAYKKRLELKKLFEAEGSAINPLVLIQIPTAEAGEDKIKAVKAFFAAKGIAERKNGRGNGKLAIWTAEQKSETLDWVAEPTNEIEFLIFKQAIDTGWDCPRAHVLVKFRESHSEIFEIQTVGRILRMPEWKHYSHDSLNRGYIYTNVQSIIVKKEDYNPNIIKHLKAVTISAYKSIKLPSYYKSRVDYGDVTSSFDAVFDAVVCKEFGTHSKFSAEKNKGILEKRGVLLKLNKYQEEIVRDAKVDGKTFDELAGSISADQRVKLNIAGNDLQALFDQTIKNNLGSFKNVKRSVPKIRATIYVWFRKYLGSEAWKEEALLIQKIFLNEKNRPVFERLLAAALENYRILKGKELEKRAKENEQYYLFDILSETFYNEHTDEVYNAKKYVYNPCYLSIARLTPERDFEKYLEAADVRKGLVWWWKNGEGKKDYFGIRYEYPAGISHTFYPDYLIKTSSGKLLILEVKDMGDQDGAGPTKSKAEALQAYIDENGGKMKLFGGVCVRVKGQWRVNSKPKYDWEKCLRKDWTDWEVLAL